MPHPLPPRPAGGRKIGVGLPAGQAPPGAQGQQQQQPAQQPPAQQQPPAAMQAAPWPAPATLVLAPGAGAPAVPPVIGGAPLVGARVLPSFGLPTGPMLVPAASLFGWGGGGMLPLAMAAAYQPPPTPGRPTRPPRHGCGESTASAHSGRSRSPARGGDGSGHSAVAPRERSRSPTRPPGSGAGSGSAAEHAAAWAPPVWQPPNTVQQKLRLACKSAAYDRALPFPAAALLPAIDDVFE